MSKVHQIFWDFYGRGMSGLFLDSALKFEEWSKKHGYEYRLWSEKECNELMEKYPKYLKMYTEARYKIMKVDIVRLCILHSEGGLYADLDVFPNRDGMKFGDLIFAIDKTSKGQNKKAVITNEIMQCAKGNPFIIGFLDYIKTQIKEKKSIGAYDVRKARFVLHTTGPYALQRYLKQQKITCECYKTNQLEFGKNWQYKGLGNTKGVDFICHNSLSWYESLK